MNNIAALSVAQLQRAITIKEQIEALNAELASVLGALPAPTPDLKALVATPPAQAKKKKVMSPAARAKIAAAQKARWAKVKGVSAAKAPQAPVVKAQTSKPKPKMSAAGRANIIAAQKLRWAKGKVAQGPAKPQTTKPVQKKSNVSAEARRKMAEAAKARWAKIKTAMK